MRRRAGQLGERCLSLCVGCKSAALPPVKLMAEMREGSLCAGQFEAGEAGQGNLQLVPGVPTEAAMDMVKGS